MKGEQHISYIIVVRRCKGSIGFRSHEEPDALASEDATT